MACRTDGDSLGDPVLDAAEPAYDGGRDGSRDSRDRDGDDGDGGYAPDLLGDDGTVFYWMQGVLYNVPLLLYILLAL